MKHFTEGEFRCRCCGGLPPDAQENIRALVEAVLDPARERYGGPVTVNSGYRCAKHNREVGGVSASQHLRGEAADIVPVNSEKFLDEPSGKAERKGHYFAIELADICPFNNPLTSL